MGPLVELFATREDNVINEVLRSMHASGLDTKMMSERIARETLSRIACALREFLTHVPTDVVQTSVDRQFESSIASFGATEAKLIHAHGETLAAFIILMKHCRRIYLEMLSTSDVSPHEQVHGQLVVEHFFERLELECCSVWPEHSEPLQTDELQTLLLYRSDLARLVSEISTEFVGLTPDQTGGAIEDALAKIGRFAIADAAYAVRFTEDGRQFSETHVWRASDAAEPPNDIVDLELSSVAWWMDRLRESEFVVIQSIDDLPPQAVAERQFLHTQGIESLLGVPLSFQNTVVGFMAISSTTRGRKWSEDEVYLLRIFGQVLTNALRRQHAEEIIARERLLLRALIDNLPDYIYVKDTHSRFILNNAAHLRLLRAESADAVAGKTDFDIFPKPLATRYFDDEQAVIKSRQPLVNREEQVIDEQRHKLWVMTTKVPFTDAQGNVAGIVGMSRNITERKHMEEAIKNHSKLLEQANADLKRRNQDLDEFTYVASHDLQEPLRKLTAFSDALREDLDAGDREAVLKDLDVLSSGAQRMQRLVQDLLALSRSGRQKMNVVSTRLDDCVNGALDALEIRVKDTKAEILRIPLPVLRGDPSMLTQLYQNLIGNALKFCDEECPKVQLTAERIEGAWVLGVHDNGIGIKPEYAKQIFAPFKRLHGRGRYEGTGIGLAICRKIVERHGGAIWVESELGQGAYFKFTLPEK